MENVRTKTAIVPIRRRSLWRRVLGVALAADAAHREHHALKNMPDHLRRDIGLLPEGCWEAPAIMQSRTLW